VARYLRGGGFLPSLNQKNTFRERHPAGNPFRPTTAHALRRFPAFSYTHRLKSLTIRTALSPAGANAVRRPVLIQPANGVGPGDERSTFMLLNNGRMTETGIRNGCYIGSPTWNVGSGNRIIATERRSPDIVRRSLKGRGFATLRFWLVFLTRRCTSGYRHTIRSGFIVPQCTKLSFEV
jgi:hypothetical protein